MAKEKKPKEQEVDLGAVQQLVETALELLDKLQKDVDELKNQPAPEAVADAPAGLEARVASLEKTMNRVKNQIRV